MGGNGRNFSPSRIVVRSAAGDPIDVRSETEERRTKNEDSLGLSSGVWIPEGVNDAEVREMLLRGYGIEIGGGLGELAGKVWRVGLMGESSKPEYVLALLSALENILPQVGYEVAAGASVGAASKALAEM